MGSLQARSFASADLEQRLVRAKGDTMEMEQYKVVA